MLMIVIFYSFLKEKNQRNVLAIITTATGVIFLCLNYILKVNICNYIYSSLMVINGYADAMGLPFSMAMKRFQYAALIVIFYNIASIYYIWRSEKMMDSIVRYMVTAAYIFIMFKYSFARFDGQQCHTFFIFILVAVGVQYLFESGAYQSKLKEIAIVNFFWAGILFYNSNHQFLGRPEILRSIPVGYLKDISGGAKEKFTFSKSDKEGRIFPDRILKKIGKAPIDLMPINLSLIFINELNYCPRPTIQSYCAYNTYLDSLNCKKYISTEGPRFVLYRCDAISYRVPFWDEAATKRSLCQFYNLIDSFNINDEYKVVDGDVIVNGEYSLHSKTPIVVKYLLFEKRAVPRSARVFNQREHIFSLNEPLYVDTGIAPQYLFANIEFSTLGKIKNLLCEPSYLKAIFCYANGEQDTFRAVRPILATGVLINKKVKTTEDASIFFSTNGAHNDKVKWVKFVPEDSYSFKNDFQYFTNIIKY